MTPYSCNRRSVLGLVSLAALGLSGCMKQSSGPEEIHYGREGCAMCGMIISDVHFASEIRNASDKKLVKFDDFGCALNWLKAAKWQDSDVGEFWVMDHEDGTTWLEARTASYISGVVTPMNYGYGAVKDARPGSLTFTKVQQEVVAKGPSNYCNPGAEQKA